MARRSISDVTYYNSAKFGHRRLAVTTDVAVAALAAEVVGLGLGDRCAASGRTGLDG
jgi:hypothetical protein